jgi:photosynthetic reaction center H subunit
LAPDVNRVDGSYTAQPAHGWLGAPLEPVGDPLLAGVGPGAWAARADEPDLYHGGDIKIVPLRIASDHGVMSPDIDPRGLPVYGLDRFEAGHVKDLWVDRCEMMFRYLEVSLHSGGTVLLPMTFSRINRRGVHVSSILASQFANVPKTKSDAQITLLEEEKITAYYGAGTLYAMPERQEPLF